MEIVYLLLLNAAVVSAWWATFHEETPRYDRYNMKDTCIATYETLMKDMGQPATREKGSKKKSYRKTYPNLFIDEYVCAVKCHECMTNGGGGLYKKLIAKANLQNTAAQSTISCKCKKAKNGQTCKVNDIPWLEATALFAHCYNDTSSTTSTTTLAPGVTTVAPTATTTPCNEGQGSIFLMSDKHTYMTAVNIGTQIEDTTKIDCMELCRNNTGAPFPCFTAVYNRNSKVCYIYARKVELITSPANDLTLISPLEPKDHMVVIERQCVSAAMAEDTACNFEKIDKFPLLAHIDKDSEPVTGSYETWVTNTQPTMGACLEHCYTYKVLDTEKPCAFVVYLTHLNQCFLFQQPAFRATGLEQFDELPVPLRGFDTAMLSSCTRAQRA